MKWAGRVLIATILWAAPLILFPAIAQVTAGNRLGLGAPLQRSLEGAAADSLVLPAVAGDFIKVVAIQNGTDVHVALLSPGGQIIIESDSPNEAFGPETIVVIAAETGDYTIETRLGDPKIGKGSYEIQLRDQRPARQDDREEVDAFLTLYAAFRLAEQPAPQSLKSAIEAFEKVIPYFARRGDVYYQAFSLLGLASMKAQSGDMSGALRSAEESAPLFHDARDLYGEAQAWNNVGGISDVLGEPAKATEAYNRALELFNRAGNRVWSTTVLNNLGKLRGDAGDWQAAIGYYSAALTAFREINNTTQEAAVLNNLGVSYRSLGDVDQAMALLNQAIELRRKLKDVRGEAESLSQLGRAYEQRDLPQQALVNCQKAQALFTSVGDKLRQAAARRCIGRAQIAFKDYVAAEKSLREAVELSRSTQDRRSTALVRVDLARALNLAGRSDEAASSVSQALAELRALGDASSEESALTLTANIDKDRGHISAARANIEAALNLGESNRSRTDSEQLRATLFATRHESYSLYIDLLMQSGESAQAFEASERSRARSLIDMLGEAPSQLREGVDPKLLARQRDISEALNAKGARLLPLLARNRESDPRVAALRREIAALERDEQDVEVAIRKNNPRYASLAQPEPLTLARIQGEVLDSDTLLLEYSLGEQRSFLFVVGQHSFAGFELPARAKIEALTRRAYDLLTARAVNVAAETPSAKLARIAQADAAFPQAASELSAMILGPANALLQNKRIAIVADGELQRLPFAALPVPGSHDPLVLSHELTVQPSASALALLRQQTSGRKPAPKMLAVFADPVFDRSDPRISGGVLPSAPAPEASRILVQLADPGGGTVAALRIPRLPYTAQEAKEILHAAAGTSSLKALDFQASRDVALSGKLGDYRYLHFATHGYLDVEHPDLSALLLAQYDPKGAPLDGFLRVPDIYNTRLSADLVVLSACQTGLGKEVRGEGVMGLTRAFLYAGAPRVIVSLWNVNDRATASLMASLYRAMLRGGMPPASALRAAQLEMRKQKRWEAPYYWAAFVENGEWN
jgi:CHAT domain-containing protein/Flp pilus assembly protein TadD